MQRLFHRKISALLGLLVLALAGPACAESITLRPAVVPLEGRHGQSVTQVLTLQNDSDVPLDFVMEARDVVVRDGHRVSIEAGQLPDSVAATAVFQPHTLRVEAHSSASVTATLTLPPTLHHRAVVAYFRGTNLVQAGDRNARLSLGTLFTFTLSDRISLDAGPLEAAPPSANSNASLRTTLVNDGHEPWVPAGMAVLLDAEGRMVGKVPFPVRRLLPGERATVVADYPGELRAGQYRVVATFDVRGRALTRVTSLVME